jgi:hypothetical protein
VKVNELRLARPHVSDGFHEVLLSQQVRGSLS